MSNTDVSSLPATHAEAPQSASPGVPTGDLVRRLGRFHISRGLLREAPPELKQLFGECIVVEAQMRWERDAVEYLAMSARFELVPEGMMAPLYEITFCKDETGTHLGEITKSIFA